MANKIQKIHYIEDFSFSFVYPLDKQYNYIASVKTLGLNEYKAEWFYLEDIWVGENATIDGDEITINVREHDLPAGKVMVHVNIIDNGEEVGCFDVDPNVFLTFTNNVISTNPDEVDEEQSFNLNRLDAELVKVKTDLSDLDKGVDELENKFYEAANAHHKRLDNLDKVTTASQAALTTLNENFDKLADDVEANFERISNLEKEFEDKDDFFGQIVEDFSTLSQKQDALTTDISKFTSIYDDRLTIFDTALHKAQDDIDTNATKISDLTKSHSSLIESYNRDINNLNERISNLILNSGSGNSADLADVYLELTQIKQDAKQLRDYVDTIDNHTPFNPSDLQDQINDLDRRISFYDEIDFNSFLTEHQDISNLATKEELQEAIEAVDVSDQLTDYVKNIQLGNILTDYAKKSDIKEYDDSSVKQRLSNLEGIDFNNFATKDLLNYYQIVGDYALRSELNNYQPKGNYVNASELDNLATKEDIKNFITAGEVENYDDTDVKSRLAALEALDHKIYATKQELEEYCKLKDNYALKTDLTPLATKEDIKNFITADDVKPYDDSLLKSRISELENFDHSVFATKNDLNPLATKSQLEDYVTNSKLNLELRDYATLNDLPDTTELEEDITNVKKDVSKLKQYPFNDYALKEELDNYQPKGNYLINHQDISHLATEESVQSIRNIVDVLKSGKTAVFKELHEICEDKDNTLYFLWSEQQPRKALYFWDDEQERWMPVGEDL